MSTAKDELSTAKRICWGNDGKFVSVVEYDRAVAALDTQKAELVACFKTMLTKVALAQSLGRQENWERILDNMVKDI